MARKFPEQMFDPENDTIKKSAAQRLDDFIPVEQIPDPNPDPLQALIAKEESEKEIRQRETNAPAPVENDGTVDISAYRTHDYPDRKPFDQHLEPDVPEHAEKIVEKVEKGVLAGKKPQYWEAPIHQSHGKRGRKPTYKDRPIPPPELHI